MSNSWTYKLPQKAGVTAPDPESTEAMAEWLSLHYPNFSSTAFHAAWDRQIILEDSIGMKVAPEFITENGTLVSIIFETTLGDNDDFPVDEEWKAYHQFYMNFPDWDTAGSWTKNPK